MSSILIKGMEMPKTCEVCDFCHWSNLHQTGICDRCDDEPVCVDYGTDYKRGRASFCPLVEVLEPHGDLVDRDKLMTDVIDSDLDHLQRDDWKEVIQIVEDAYTIIEAEGSEE